MIFPHAMIRTTFIQIICRLLPFCSAPPRLPVFLHQYEQQSLRCIAAKEESKEDNGWLRRGELDLGGLTIETKK